MPSHIGSRAWHIEQRPSTMSRVSSKPGAAANFCSNGVSGAAAASSTGRNIGAAESQTMIRNSTTVTGQVQTGLPVPAWRVLK